MKYQKSAIELIQTRTSTRTFEPQPMDKRALEALETELAKINEETALKAKFFISHFKNDDGKSDIKVGTYGVISGAGSYIIAVLDKEEKNAVEFGYLFEKIILFATDLGLQTCWLGGTFKKSDFEQNLTLSDNETIPIISPVGNKKEKPRVFEKAMRSLIGADKRKPWSDLFFDGSTERPLVEKQAGVYAVPLEMVRLGPSASNKQPWRIVKDGASFHFMISRTKGYGVTAFDMQLNDLGIAKCHFELSAKEQGLSGRWETLSNVTESSGFEYVFSWLSE